MDYGLALIGTTHKGLQAVCLTMHLTLMAFYGNFLQIKGTGFTSRTIVTIKRPILKF
jgi:hypothetical protein